MERPRGDPGRGPCRAGRIREGDWRRLTEGRAPRIVMAFGAGLLALLDSLGRELAWPI